MDMFKKVNVSHVVWYLLPGLGLIILMLFPLMVFKPHVASAFLNSVGIMGIIVLGIILGFFLDGLRLYRLLRIQVKHSKIREDFFQKLKNTIDNGLDPYFILYSISDIADSKEITGISLHHAIWIMLGHFTVLVFLETFFWVLVFCHIYFLPDTVYTLFSKDMTWVNALAICAGFSCLFFVIGCQFLTVYREEQDKTNKMYLNFAEQFKDEICQKLNINIEKK